MKHGFIPLDLIEVYGCIGDLKNRILLVRHSLFFIDITPIYTRRKIDNLKMIRRFENLPVSRNVTEDELNSLSFMKFIEPLFRLKHIN